MFNNDSKPSKNYSYGAAAPTENAALVTEQIWLAHRYRNQLVDLERTRRERVAAALRERFPNIASLEQEAAALKEQIAALRADIKRQNAQQRRKTGTTEQRAQIKALSAQRKEKYAQFKAQKAAAWTDEELKTQLKRIEEWARGKKIPGRRIREGGKLKELRAGSGLFWGTYLAVEQTMQGARQGPPPKFHRWTGEGKIAVQLQGGLAFEDALAGRDNRLRIHLGPVRKLRWRHQHYRDTVQIRVGTAANGRAPIWATVPVSLQRLPPPGSMIKWAYLHRWRVATHDEWTLTLVLSRDDGWYREGQATSGVVAIDPGWRLVEGGMRVAYWRGADGNEGQLIIPQEKIDYRRHADLLYSVQDNLFNGIKATLAAWVNGQPPPEWLESEAAYLERHARGQARAGTHRKRVEQLRRWAGEFRLLTQRWSQQRPDIPNWLHTQLARLTTWRSKRRLAKVVLHWRANRFPGDEAIYAVVEAWRAQDRHLYDVAENQRRRFHHWRNDFYRNFAADLAGRYHTAVIEDTDWSKLQKLPQVEKNETATDARYYGRLAAVGMLLEIVRETLADTSHQLAENTTRTCHVCGRLCEWDQAAELVHQCEHPGCSATWDQDMNACVNLLRLYRENQGGEENPGDLSRDVG